MMKKIINFLFLCFMVLLTGCIIGTDIDENSVWEYTYLVTCSDSLTNCKVDIWYVTPDGRQFVNDAKLPWSIKVRIHGRDDETITPKLEVKSDGNNKIKAILTSTFSKDGKVDLNRFPQTLSYRNMTSIEIYKLFYSLTSASEGNISTDDWQELNSLVDVFLDAKYKYSAILKENETYIKINE